jgi:hypothetical protein
MVAIKGHFDGKVFVPDEPVDFARGQKLILHIEPAQEPPATDGDAWDVLDSLTGTVEAPSDWSAQHDHYLYGTPRRPAK